MRSHPFGRRFADQPRQQTPSSGFPSGDGGFGRRQLPTDHVLQFVVFLAEH